MKPVIRTGLASLFLAFFLLKSYGVLAETGGQAQTVLHMLDYVSVDYGEAVRDGKVLDEGEYKEQAEFAAEVEKLLAGLPDNPRRSELLAEARSLSGDVAAKQDGKLVSDKAQALRRAIIAAYRVPVSPRQAPDLARAKVLYIEHCAACHGVEGRGDGAAGRQLDPAPSNFHDGPRMDQRSVYGLYNTISLGVAGTGMASFAQLSEEERWALAFLVSNSRSAPDALEWGGIKAADLARLFPDLSALASRTVNEVRTGQGEDAVAVFAYLRARPQALGAGKPRTLERAVAGLDAALQSYRQGDFPNAKQQAIAAYLEGFEPVEAGLDNINPELRRDIERELMALRAQIDRRVPTQDLARSVEKTRALLQRAGELLEGSRLSSGGAYASALLILLREGLEAMLVLAAVIAFVIRNGRRDALKYVHAGWVLALALGLLTWAAATWLVDISGAQREITEGATALLASAMLVYVGLWLHGKSHARAWQSFLQGQVGSVLERKTLWSLALIAFLAVYREMFETVLFYQALWAQVGEGGRGPLWAGMGSAALALALIGWAMLRLGLRLPLKPFFNVMALMLGAMAVIFAGQGVAALQEAGLVGASGLEFATLPLLGVFPTWQTLLGQLAVIFVLLLGYACSRRKMAA
jgi:high-affinity iron transporter